MTLEDALSFFYNSSTYELISEGVADMHCLGRPLTFNLGVEVKFYEGKLSKIKSKTRL